MCWRMRTAARVSRCAHGISSCWTRWWQAKPNWELERCFGAVRYHERRATGRRGAIPGVVVRGAVRVLTALVCRAHPPTADDLPPADYAAWRQVRQQLAYREEARRRQSRFRKDAPTYLAAIEARLLQ